jgi:hypothetical protein
MTPDQFTYWLQGFAEINQEAPTKEQWEVIKDHLQLVFKKETPVYNRPTKGEKWPSSFPPLEIDMPLCGTEQIC